MLDSHVAKSIIRGFSWPACVPRPKMTAGMGERSPLTGGRPLFVVKLEGKKGQVIAIAVSPERALLETVVMWIQAHNPELPAEALAMKLYLPN